MKNLYWFGIYLLLGLWLLVSPYALGFVENYRLIGTRLDPVPYHWSSR
jgi:hypothetical protein